MIDLDAIRARDAADMPLLPSLQGILQHVPDEELRQAILQITDRNELLTYVDALRAAAGKVVDDLTEACDDSDGIPYGTLGTRYVREVIADLRRLLEGKP